MARKNLSMPARCGPRRGVPWTPMSGRHVALAKNNRPVGALAGMCEQCKEIDAKIERYGGSPKGSPTSRQSRA